MQETVFKFYFRYFLFVTIVYEYFNKAAFD